MGMVMNYKIQNGCALTKTSNTMDISQIQNNLQLEMEIHMYVYKCMYPCIHLQKNKNQYLAWKKEMEPHNELPNVIKCTVIHIVQERITANSVV